MRFSIYRWGGHPVTSTNHGDPTLDADVAVYRRWAGLLSDSASVREEWLQWVASGKAWLEGPSTDSSRRLLLRAFYERPGGGRGIWHFFGITLPIESIAPPAWATTLGGLVALGKDELERIVGQLSFPEATPPDFRGDCESPYGRIYNNGSYADLLSQLCHSLSCSTWDELKRISIACHPPCSLPGFSTLILSDDFPPKNIGIKEEMLPASKIATPVPKSVDFVSGQSPVQFKRIVRPRWWWVPLNFVVGLVVGITIGNSRRGSEIVRLKRENSELRMHSQNLMEELTLKRAENQNLTEKLSLEPAENPVQPRSTAVNPVQDRKGK
jgi:hypothetical protein